MVDMIKKVVLLYAFMKQWSCFLQGIIERDQIVFQKARTQGIPILMVTSGGYMRETARIIADSILNLKQMGLITCEEAENCPLPSLGTSFMQ